MKLLRPSKRTIKPRQESLIKFVKLDGIHGIFVDGAPFHLIGGFDNDDDAAVKRCWRIIGAM